MTIAYGSSDSTDGCLCPKILSATSIGFSTFPFYWLPSTVINSPGTEVGSLTAKGSTCPLRAGKVLTPQPFYTVIDWGSIQCLSERKYKNGKALCLDSTLQFSKLFNTFLSVPIVVNGATEFIA